MTYRLIFVLLYESPNVRDRVATRIFAENAPEGTQGECIIVRNLSGSAEMHMQGETDCAMPTIQIDCYAESALRAESLWQLVRNRLSGYSGSVSVLDSEGIEQAVVVSEFALRRPGHIIDEPHDGSDKWTYRYSGDFEVFHSQSVPTLT
jgi:hypothetical protein